MPFNLTNFQKSLKKAFSQIETSQAEALAIEISANYTAGRTAGVKHKSINTAGKKTAALNPAACSTAGNLAAGNLAAGNLAAGNIAAASDTAASYTAASPDEPEDPEEEGLTTEEKAEIALLIALYLGYIHKYNEVAQDQIITTTKQLIEDQIKTEVIKEETTNKIKKRIVKEVTEPEAVTDETIKEIKKRLDDVLTGQENIVIDNVGKTRKELYVDKDLNLSEVEKVITRKYTASVKTYSELLGEQASHASYEAGRKANIIRQGYSRWVFVGPSDERARAWHVALLGQTFTYMTEQSYYAERCLNEPRCRHRAQVYYNDPEKDYPAEKWQKVKDDAGLHWDEDAGAWALK